MAVRLVKSAKLRTQAGAATSSATAGPARVRIYGLPRCDSCRKARRWLDREKIPYQFVDYRAQPVEGEQLESWAAAVGWDRMINRASATWRKLPAPRRQAGTDAEWIVLLREYPALLKRPLLVMLDSPETSPQFGFSDAAWRTLLVPDSALETL